MPPRGGLAQSLGEASARPTGPERRRRRGTRRFHARVARRVRSSAEDSPSGLWRSLGKRVGCESPQGFESPILRHSTRRRSPAPCRIAPRPPTRPGQRSRTHIRSPPTVACSPLSRRSPGQLDEGGPAHLGVVQESLEVARVARDRHQQPARGQRHLRVRHRRVLVGVGVEPARGLDLLDRTPRPPGARVRSTCRRSSRCPRRASTRPRSRHPHGPPTGSATHHPRWAAPASRGPPPTATPARPRTSIPSCGSGSAAGDACDVQLPAELVLLGRSSCACRRRRATGRGLSPRTPS